MIARLVQPREEQCRLGGREMEEEEADYLQRQPLLSADPDDILLESGLGGLGDGDSGVTRVR